MATRRTSPAREVEAVAEKLHSAALLLLRRLRTEGDARGISPPRLAALSVVVDNGPIGIGSLAAAEVISHYGPRPQVSLKDLAASKGL